MPPRKMVKIVKFGVCIMNDSVNSFEHVTHTLQDVLSWDITQAANCASITHYKGEYVVKWLDSEEAALYVAQVLHSSGLKVKIITDKNATI